MKRKLFSLCALSLLAVLPAKAADLDPRPHIDVVFAIDCSGSMGGVINTAKQKIWSIVNEIAKAKPSPVLRIGLHGYGNAERSFRNYPLTDDLDRVYADLMTFKDEGWSDEYVGLSIQKTTKEMDWKDWEKIGASNVLRVLYVVGNETAEQGPVSYKVTAPAALHKQIFVNAIYCGEGGRGIANHLPVQPNTANTAGNQQLSQGQKSIAKTMAVPAVAVKPVPANAGHQIIPLTPEVATWQELAMLGGGEFSQIAAEGGGVTIATPYDKDFAALNTKLNGTYVAYGASGKEFAANQALQDTNALSVGGTANLAARAQAKSSAQYNSRRWDLVDACKEKGFDLAKIPKAELPAEMQKMTPAEQKHYLATKENERAALQKQIGDLGRKREDFVQAELKKNGANLDKALDEQILRTIRSQAIKRGFKY